MQAFYKLLMINAILALCGFSVWAQDNENEFQRVATRVLKQYEDPDIMPDTTGRNALWDGGAYFGVGSNGRIMPSANFRYKRGKMVFTGNVAMEIADRNSSKQDDTWNADRYSQTANTDIHRKYEQADASVRVDYYPSLADCFSFGLLENFNHTRRNEEAVTTFYDEAGAELSATIAKQLNVNRNQKSGALLQWKHLFASKAMLMARMNLRYLYQKIAVDKETWKQLADHSTSQAEEKWSKFTPYAQVRYQSQNWGGFTFSADERLTLERMKVTDLAADFRYHSTTSTTKLSLDYSRSSIRLYATGGYEFYRNTIDEVSRSHNDWVFKAGAKWKMSKQLTAEVSFDRSFTRPTYSQFYDKKHLGSSLGTYVIGNRNLNSSVKSQHKFALAYKPKRQIDLALEVMYEKIDRDITQVSGYDEEEQTSFKTWINDANYNNVHLAFDGKWLLGPLDLRWHMKAKHITYEGENVNDEQRWSWYFKIRPEVALGYGWKVAGAVYYTGKEVHRTHTEAAYTYVSLRAVKEIGAWALYAFVQDIFERRRHDATHSTTNAVITRTDQGSRAAIIGASYTF
ncbi:MAG: TonB-dependent receptor [Bacteroidales bacterium]|nr:TonB-dependent receptor [Bacteroidales bacterium]